jgi:hypothetical protein
MVFFLKFFHKDLIYHTYSVILRSPLSSTGRCKNLIHLLRHSEERIMRRENLIIENIYEETKR